MSQLRGEDDGLLVVQNPVGEDVSAHLSALDQTLDMKPGYVRGLTASLEEQMSHTADPQQIPTSEDSSQLPSPTNQASPNAQASEPVQVQDESQSRPGRSFG